MKENSQCIDNVSYFIIPGYKLGLRRAELQYQGNFLFLKCILREIFKKSEVRTFKMVSVFSKNSGVLFLSCNQTGYPVWDM